MLVGLLYGFFIAIICGQRINERHYHVLAKQELTKVYYLTERKLLFNADLIKLHYFNFTRCIVMDELQISILEDSDFSLLYFLV